jgi:hypothetical protein
LSFIAHVAVAKLSGLRSRHPRTSLLPAHIRKFDFTANAFRLVDIGCGNLRRAVAEKPLTQFATASSSSVWPAFLPTHHMRRSCRCWSHPMESSFVRRLIQGFATIPPTTDMQGVTSVNVTVGLGYRSKL